MLGDYGKGQGTVEVQGRFAGIRSVATSATLAMRAVLAEMIVEFD